MATRSFVSIEEKTVVSAWWNGVCAAATKMERKTESPISAALRMTGRHRHRPLDFRPHRNVVVAYRSSQRYRKMEVSVTCYSRCLQEFILRITTGNARVKGSQTFWQKLCRQDTLISRGTFCYTAESDKLEGNKRGAKKTAKRAAIVFKYRVKCRIPVDQSSSILVY